MLGSSGMIVAGQTGLDCGVELEWDSDVDGKRDTSCGGHVKGEKT